MGQTIGELRRLDTQNLIDHILDRFHAAHRRDVPKLIQLAEAVAAEHGSCPAYPAGLIAALNEAGDELEQHMRKEEEILFPLMLGGGHPMIGCPIGQMRVEHDEHQERIASLLALTDNLTPPETAGPLWTALYVGIGQLLADLRAHIESENEVLFPRFAAADTEAA